MANNYVGSSLFNYLYEKSADEGLASVRSNSTAGKTLAGGTGDEQFDLLLRFTDQLNTANSWKISYDLSGTLEDIYGQSGVFAKVKGVYIQNKSTSLGQLDIFGDDAGTEFKGPIADVVGSYLRLDIAQETNLINSKSGWTVTGASNDLLVLEENTGALDVDFDLILIGVRV